MTDLLVSAVSCRPAADTFTLRSDPSPTLATALLLKWEKTRVRIPVTPGRQGGPLAALGASWGGPADQRTSGPADQRTSGR
jgi:hypothetical protein